MKLFYIPGACSQASHIILHEIGAAFDIEKVDPAEKKTETGTDFRTISPNGYVPALSLDDGEVITENPALLQYLGDLSPDRNLAPPAGSMARVRLQEMLNFVSSELHKAYGPFFSGRTLTAEEKDVAYEKLGSRVGYLESRLSDGRAYLLGDEFTVADAYAFVVLGWSGNVGFALEAFLHVAAYVVRIRHRPSVAAALRSEGLIAA